MYILRYSVHKLLEPLRRKHLVVHGAIGIDIYAIIINSIAKMLFTLKISRTKITLMYPKNYVSVRGTLIILLVNLVKELQDQTKSFWGRDGDESSTNLTLKFLIVLMRIIILASIISVC